MGVQPEYGLGELITLFAFFSGDSLYSAPLLLLLILLPKVLVPALHLLHLGSVPFQHSAHLLQSSALLLYVRVQLLHQLLFL
jgi:hypothetical protein